MFMVQSFKDMLAFVHAQNGGVPQPGSEAERTFISAVICGILQGLGAEIETLFTEDGYISGFICEGVTYYIGVNTLELIA